MQRSFSSFLTLLADLALTGTSDVKDFGSASSEDGEPYADDGLGDDPY